MFDYHAINTDKAKNISDEKLLMLIDHIEFANGLPSGWGLLAELCKRFEQKIQEIERMELRAEELAMGEDL